MKANNVSIRVWGDFACFTRPEMKVERVSYPIITPSAARGVFESIFWEPEVLYRIDAVRVVKKGRWIGIRRNEVTSRVSIESAKTWMSHPEKIVPIKAGGGADDGTQRNMLALAEVEYILSAEIGLTEIGKKGRHSLAVYREEIERRARQGKCFHRPSLGVREFAADFEWEADPQVALERRVSELRPNEDWRDIWPDEDLGIMLYDVFDPLEREIGFKWTVESPQGILPEVKKVDGKTDKKSGRSSKAVEPYEGKLVRPKTLFFHARIRDSMMDCHPDRIKMLAVKREEGYAS